MFTQQCVCAAEPGSTEHRGAEGPAEGRAKRAKHAGHSKWGSRCPDSSVPAVWGGLRHQGGRECGIQTSCQAAATSFERASGTCLCLIVIQVFVEHACVRDCMLSTRQRMQTRDANKLSGCCNMFWRAIRYCICAVVCKPSSSSNLNLNLCERQSPSSCLELNVSGRPCLQQSM